MKRLLLIVLTSFASQTQAMEGSPTAGATRQHAYAHHDALRASTLNLRSSNGTNPLAAQLSKHFLDKTLTLELYETHKNNRLAVSQFVYENQTGIIEIAQKLADEPTTSLAHIENCYVALNFFFDRAEAEYCNEITEIIRKLVQAHEALLRKSLTADQNSTSRDEIVRAKACADMLYSIVKEDQERIKHTAMRTMLANRLKNDRAQKSSWLTNVSPELLIGAGIAVAGFLYVALFKTSQRTGI